MKKKLLKKKILVDITGLRLSNEQRQKLKEHGYYTYDIRCDSFSDGDYVSNKVIINHIGTLITTKDLHLSDSDSIELNKAIKDCEEKHIDLDLLIDTGRNCKYGSTNNNFNTDFTFHLLCL